MEIDGDERGSAANLDEETTCRFAGLVSVPDWAQVGRFLIAVCRGPGTFRGGTSG
jgi:hypothetical protein